MTLVVHWGNGEYSIFDGLPWEVHSEGKTLMVFDKAGGECGTIQLKDIVPPISNSVIYHVWTDATEWSRS